MVRPLRFAVVLPVLALSGCRTPTSVELKLSTNVSCADKPSTAITVNRSSTATQEPATITTSCQADGTIGSIVILPASSKDETLLVRVVTSLKDPVETACQPPAYGPGCIVSRRSLSFVAHEELQLPVVQELDCAGLQCGESQTCRKGSCVSAQVDLDHCASSPQDCGQELIPDIPLGSGGRAGAGGTGGAGAGGVAGKGGAGMGGAGAAGQGGAGQGGAGQGGAGQGGAGQAGAGSGPLVATESPFGIATSASSSYSLDSWASQIAATGITWMRGIDNNTVADKLTIAQASGLKVSSILLYSKMNPTSFPLDDLPGWASYTTDLVTKTKGQIKHWEVWNEPPNFTADPSPASYATIVKAAYDAAKAVDPSVQIGLATKSNHVNWLEQAILAGAQDHFDYVTLHPYEVFGQVEQGCDALYLSIPATLRKMLAARSPKQKDVPIWFTEIGEPVGSNVTPEQQAIAVIKTYTLAIAGGVSHVHWFEGKDGDSGPFGLIDAQGTKRPSYTAISALISQLGALPAYDGWVLLGGQHYGFVFEGLAGPVMVAWSQPGTTDMVMLDGSIQVIDPQTGQATPGNSFLLTPKPVIVTGVPVSLVNDARNNRNKPFWWGGDYSSATTISYAPGAAQGLHALGTEDVVTIEGQPARDVSKTPALSFVVDPNFLSYTTAPIQITARVRANSAQSAGFNLKYESTKGYTSTGSWNGVPGSDKWYDLVWLIDDDQFVGYWGYHFWFDSDSTQYSNYSVQSVTVTRM